MAQPVVVEAGGVRWSVMPEYREQLLGPEGLRLEEWLRAGLARVVKHGPFRTVYRVDLPGLSCFVKHNRLSGVRSWLRQLVRPSKARIEYRRALAVAGRQVPTIAPLALGERGGGLQPGDSFLITRCLDGSEPLSHFIEPTLQGLAGARQTRVRQRLAVELGRLVAHLHDAGIAHHDLHSANLLVGLDGTDRLRLHVIDLHAVRVGRPLSWRASRANLVLLGRWFVLRASRADRLRFWRAYCAARVRPDLWPACTTAPPGRGPLLLARDLERRTWEANWHFWRNRDRRCLATNKYYRRVRSGAAAGHAVTDLDPAALTAFLADPDEPFRRPGVTLLKDSPSSTVAELEVSVGGVVRRVVYKRFRVTTWSDPWAALLRPAPALRSWVHGHGLRERGLPTARPLAVFHRRRLGLAYEGYLLTEKIPQACDLLRFVNGLGRLAARDCRTRLRCLIDQVAGLVRELHRRRLSHRDLKAANILVSREGSAADIEKEEGAAAPRLWLIDLVGVTCRHRLRRRRRVQNLTRLHASFLQGPMLTRTDKVRFLRAYLQWNLRGRASWKQWWKEIEEATRHKIVRNARNGRPLA
jgi:tRNA A-37 threonylcarbamoyl transferase component Bud32